MSPSSIIFVISSKILSKSSLPVSNLSSYFFNNSLKAPTICLFAVSAVVLYILTNPQYQNISTA